MTPNAAAFEHRLFKGRWNLALYTILVLAISALSCSCAAPQTRAGHLLIDMTQAFQAATDPDTTIHGCLNTAGGREVPYEFSITSKGNGVLQVGGLWFRAYDGHNEGSIFDPCLLSIITIENSAGEVDGLSLSGSLVEYDEKGDHVVGHRPIAVECRFDNTSGQLLVTRADPAVILAAP